MKPRATRGSNTTGQRPVGIFLRAEPLDRALAGALADLGRVAQIGGVDRAGDSRSRAPCRFPEPPITAGADPVARPGIGAGKAVRGGKRDARAAPAGLGPLGIGDALDRQRRLLGGARALDQHLGGWLLGVEHVERRPLVRDLGRDRRCRRYGSSGTARAIATVRSTSSASIFGERSLDDTIACCWPMKTRSPRSWLSERSSFSVLPRRRACDSEMPSNSTASAASAPAFLARRQVLQQVDVGVAVFVRSIQSHRQSRTFSRWARGPFADARSSISACDSHFQIGLPAAGQAVTRPICASPRRRSRRPCGSAGPSRAWSRAAICWSRRGRSCRRGPIRARRSRDSRSACCRSRVTSRTGSMRVETAHITSFQSRASMSSSTTMTNFVYMNWRRNDQIPIITRLAWPG